METFPWVFVLIGGPLLLLAAFIWAYARSARQDNRIDPDTPGDDPSKACNAHLPSKRHFNAQCPPPKDGGLIAGSDGSTKLDVPGRSSRCNKRRFAINSWLSSSA